MAHFTHYWKYETVADHQTMVRGREIPSKLDHTAGEQFKSRRVTAGDWLYVISFRAGELRVVARLEVEDIVSQRLANKRLSYNPWRATEHVMAVPGSGSPIRFESTVPTAEVGAIRFLTTDGASSAPAMNRRGDFDPQTFRGVRQITEATAAIFDKVLGV